LTGTGARLHLLLRPHRVAAVDADELRDSGEVVAVTERIALLRGPFLRDVGAERQRPVAGARAQKRRAVAAVDPR
jgi:hypothetical protein